VVFAYRDGSNSAPSLASGFTNISSSGGANTNSSRLAYKWAASSSESVGTWTNATDIIVHVYRGVTRIGTSTVGSGSSASVTYPALTLEKAGTSWVARFAGNRTSITGGTPGGYTQRQTQTRVKGLDSNGAVPSDPGAATQAGTNTGWHARSLELRGDLGMLANDFMDAFNGVSSTPDPSKWSVLMPNGGTATVDTVNHELDLAITSEILGTDSVRSIGTIDMDGQTLTFGPITNVSATSFGSANVGVLDAIKIGTPDWGFRFNTSGQVQAWIDGQGVGSARTHSNGDWYRLRHSGGVMYAEYSADGRSWTTQGSLTVFHVPRSGEVVIGAAYNATITIGGVNELLATGLPMKVHLGGSWVQKPMKRWDGSAWVEINPKIWDGSQWA